MRIVHFRDAYQEDIPIIVKPDKAADYIREYLSRRSGFYETIFGIDSFLYDAGVHYAPAPYQIESIMERISWWLESGDYLLLGDREDGFDTILFFGDISPFVSSTFRERVKRLPPRPQYGYGNYSKAPEPIIEPDITPAPEAPAELKETGITKAINAMMGVDDEAVNAAHYVGGVTKKVGDSITSGIESIINEPSIIKDMAENAMSTVVDGVTYFPDVVVSQIAPEYSSGSKLRTNKRINSLIDGVKDSVLGIEADYKKHKELLNSGDYESAGGIAGEYLSSLVIPSKKFKPLTTATKNLSFKPYQFKSPSGMLMTVYQQEIDWDLKVNTRNGVKTNLELALEGRSPFVVKDGKYSIVNLHHSKQNENGPLFELSMQTHKDYHGSNALHPYLPGKHPINPVDSDAFAETREAYWIERATNELIKR